MLKKMLALGLIATGTLGITVSSASANEVQQSNQYIGSTTVAVDDSYAISDNDQDIYQGMYEGYGYFPYGGNEGQLSQQGINSTTVAVDDSFAYSENDQDAVIENYESGYWVPYFYH